MFRNSLWGTYDFGNTIEEKVLRLKAIEVAKLYYLGQPSSHPGMSGNKER
jgi:hypothetical protein